MSGDESKPAKPTTGLRDTGGVRKGGDMPIPAAPAAGSSTDSGADPAATE